MKRLGTACFLLFAFFSHTLFAQFTYYHEGLGYYCYLEDAVEHTVSIRCRDKAEGSVFPPSFVTYQGIKYKVTHVYGFNETNITQITLPSSVTEIGRGNYHHCSFLQSVVVGENVWFVDPDAFGSCPSLREIRVSPNNKRYASVNGILYSKKLDTLIYCPRGITGTVTIPNSVIAIGTHIPDRDYREGYRVPSAFGVCHITTLYVPYGQAEIYKELCPNTVIKEREPSAEVKAELRRQEEERRRQEIERQRKELQKQLGEMVRQGDNMANRNEAQTIYNSAINLIRNQPLLYQSDSSLIDTLQVKVRVAKAVGSCQDAEQALHQRRNATQVFKLIKQTEEILTELSDNETACAQVRIRLNAVCSEIYEDSVLYYENENDFVRAKEYMAKAIEKYPNTVDNKYYALSARYRALCSTTDFFETASNITNQLTRFYPNQCAQITTSSIQTLRQYLTSQEDDVEQTTFSLMLSIDTLGKVSYDI